MPGWSGFHGAARAWGCLRRGVTGPAPVSAVWLEMGQFVDAGVVGVSLGALVLHARVVWVSLGALVRHAGVVWVSWARPCLGSVA